MTYLSPTQLVEAAPAAKQMDKVKDGLIDTAAFIKYIRRALGQRPVLAVQGKPHDEKGVDRKKRLRQGRHFIVLANHAGHATVLLNSHLVRRKAWIGAGYWKNGQALVGVALPLQRWRGFQPAIDDLERYRLMLSNARSSMRAYPMTDIRLHRLAQRISETAYLPGHNPISPEELKVVRKEFLYETLLAMHAVILRGNSKPADADKRKVKPVKGPDALMQLGNAVFTAGVDVMDTSMALPAYRKT